MRISTLGTGNMAQALAAHWVRAGHEVTVGGRDEEKAARLAGRIGAAAHGSLAQAARAGDAVLVALPYGVGESVVGELREPLAGKVLVDCCNPVGEGFQLLTADGPAAAQRLAAAAPGATVVKAFNLCHEDVWRLTPPVFDGRPLAVPLCGDDGQALDLVRELVRDIGCTPLSAGGLDRAALLEAAAALVIQLWVGEGADAQAMLPPVAASGGAA
ncbi:NADPH-dependent F420 reductase [Streptomyces sp. NPDC057694]|uniref:NADPH-dependent F420 reductase n=1 Tax=Streptomyces sp. NPDC057694 TaxID=3346216 RepID=UPI003683A18D